MKLYEVHVTEKKFNSNNRNTTIIYVLANNIEIVRKRTKYYFDRKIIFICNEHEIRKL